METKRGDQLVSPETRERPLLVDRINAVFSHLPDDDFYYRDKPYLHRAFQELSLEYPEHFEDMGFGGKVGETVNSDALQHAIGSLEGSGLAETFVGMRRVLMKVNRATLSSALSEVDDLKVDETVTQRFLTLLDYYETKASPWDLRNSRTVRRAEV